jgi:photosystem II stability/assembly factor-like uncharacterized protein
MKRRQAAQCLLFAAIASAMAHGQTVPTIGDQELQPVWGGQNQIVHYSDIATGRRTVIGTGGGGIRYRLETPFPGLSVPWRYAETPSDFTHTVIDIEFIDDAIGFACGRGGQVLKTTDGGLSWGNQGIPITDPCDDLATTWAIHAFDEDFWVAGGLWFGKYTYDGGDEWFDLEFHEFDDLTDPLGYSTAYDGPIVDGKTLHIYGMAVVGPWGSHKGAIAAEWHSPSGEHVGVVLYTDASDPNSLDGTVWRMTLDDSSLYTFCTVDTPDGPVTREPRMDEPWAIAFERGATIGNAVGYVVGGLGANGPGRIWRTDDGGENWTWETDTMQTPYTVTAEPGRVMVGSYSGRFYVRDGGEEGQWSFDYSTCAGCGPTTPGVNCPDVLPGPALPNGLPNLANTTTVAIQGVDSADADSFVVTGGWGLTMKSDDGGDNWVEHSPYHDLDVVEFRLQGIDAIETAPKTVYACGQIGSLGKSTDGGDTWEWQMPNNDAIFFATEFRDEDRGVAVGTEGNVYYTVDGADTPWKKGVVVDPFGTGANLPTTTFYDVDTIGNAEAFAVGYDQQNRRAVIAYTRSNGAGWFLLKAPTLNKLRLMGVACPEQTRMLVVGWSGNSPGEAKARAYHVTFNPMTGGLVWTEISPTHPPSVPGQNPPSRKLLGIDYTGTSLAGTTAYAVGNGGMVLQWNDATQSFDDVPQASSLLDTDLHGVGVSPSGDRVLIGAHYDINLHHAADFGKMIELDDGVWGTTRAFSGKNIVEIVLTSDDEGFALGQTTSGSVTGDGERLHQCNGYSDEDVGAGNFDNPNLADCIILEYRGK